MSNQPWYLRFWHWLTWLCTIRIVRHAPRKWQWRDRAGWGGVHTNPFKAIRAAWKAW